MAKATDLTFEQVSEQVAYDPESGAITWRLSKKGNKGAGSVAGCVNQKLGHWIIGILRARVYGHRVAWLLSHGEWPSAQIDHINGDRTDNRLCNLRECSHAENQQNGRRENQTGLAGVEYCADIGKFRSRVRVSGVRYDCGYHQTAEDAHLAYLEKKRELHAFHSDSRYD